MSVSLWRIDVPAHAVPRQSIRTSPAPSELRIDPSAWSALAATRADALIVGESVAVSRVLTFIWPTLRKPVFWCESRRLSLPARCQSTLVLGDAHALHPDNQQRLLEWLHSGTESPRLIATSSPLLLPLVEDGKFSRELYERFTVVKLVKA